MKTPDFFNVSPKDLPDDVISETFRTIRNYKFRCVRKIVKMKRKRKVEERWYCLKEQNGKNLPVYVREGAKRTGFKDLRSFFAVLAYYKSAFKLD